MKLLMADDTVLDIGPNSDLLLKRYHVPSEGSRDVELDMELGRVRATIQKKVKKRGKFRLKTRTSVLAVRGTTFAVDVQSNGGNLESRVVVAEGSLAVTDLLTGGGTVAVNPGNELVATGRIEDGQVVPTSPDAPPPTPQEIPPAQVQSIMEESTVEDHTFEQSVEIDDAAFEESTEEKKQDESESESNADTGDESASNDNQKGDTKDSKPDQKSANNSDPKKGGPDNSNNRNTTTPKPGGDSKTVATKDGVPVPGRQPGATRTVASADSAKNSPGTSTIAGMDAITTAGISADGTKSDSFLPPPTSDPASNTYNPTQPPIIFNPTDPNGNNNGGNIVVGSSNESKIISVKVRIR